MDYAKRSVICFVLITGSFQDSAQRWGLLKGVGYMQKRIMLSLARGENRRYDPTLSSLLKSSDHMENTHNASLLYC